MNFAQMLSANPAPPKPTKKKTRRGCNAFSMHQAVSVRARLRYAEAMRDEEITAPQLAPRLGIQAQSCLLQLYRYEKRGMVERVGLVECKLPNPPIIWRWIGEVAK